MTCKHNSMRRLTWPTLAAFGLMVGLEAAHAAGDPGRGADVFNTECAVCHSVKQGKHKLGPCLFGVVGRSAGSAPDYVYSEAMKASGLTWTEDKLEAYLGQPKGIVPGNKMAYRGLADERARADLIAYLASLR